MRRRIDNPPAEVTIALFTAYFAYLAAEAIGVSGILAAITVGIYIGRLTSRLTSPATRIQGHAAGRSPPSCSTRRWSCSSACSCRLNRRPQRGRDRGRGPDRGDRDGECGSPGCFPFTYLPRVLWARVHEREPPPPWQQTLIVAWSWIRGAVSLAAALAVPFATDAGRRFPNAI